MSLCAYRAVTDGCSETNFAIRVFTAFVNNRIPRADDVHAFIRNFFCYNEIF